MFYPRVVSRIKNWRITKLRPGGKSIALALFALMLSALFSLGPGETKSISAASPKLHEKSLENLLPGQQPPPATIPSGWPYPRSDYSISFNFSTVFSKGRGSDQ
jgi:hypothetical protein